MLSLTKVRRRFPEARPGYGRNGLEFTINCPEFHRKGGIYKMQINSETGVYHCHDCGSSGSAVHRWFDGPEDMIEALAIERDRDMATHLAQSVRERRGTFVGRGGAVWEDDVPSPGHLIPFKELPDDHPAVRYLADRKYNIEEIREFDRGQQLFYCDKEARPFRCGSTKGRLIFPIYMSDNLKGWQARKIDKTITVEGIVTRTVWDGNDWYETKKNSDNKWVDYNIPKYLTCPLMPRSEVLYGYDQARKGDELVVIVEGPLDQIRVGYPSVGTLGAVTQHQLQLIQLYWKTAVILRDPEINPESDKFQRILASLPTMRTCHLALPENKDPGDTECEVIWEEIIKEMNNCDYDLPSELNPEAS